MTETEERVLTPSTSLVLKELQQHGAWLKEIAQDRGREEPPATYIDLTQGRHLTRLSFRLTEIVIGFSAATDFELVIGSAAAFVGRNGGATGSIPFPIDLKAGVEVFVRSGGVEPPNIATLRGAYLIGYPK